MMSSNNAFVTLSQLALDTSPLQLKTTQVTQTAIGGFLELTWDSKNFFIVAGTREKPLKTPIGIKTFEKEGKSWQFVSGVLEEPDFLHGIACLDSAIESLLAAQIPSWFDTSSEHRVKYTPIASTGGEGLQPLLGGKLSSNVIIMDAVCNPLVSAGSKTSDIIATCPPGSTIRVVFKVDSLFIPKFSATCKVVLKAANIQVLEKGAEDAAVDFKFD